MQADGDKKRVELTSVLGKIEALCIFFSLQGYKYLREHQVAYKSLKVWRESSILSLKRLRPSYGRSSTLAWTSLGMPKDWSQDK